MAIVLLRGDNFRLYRKFQIEPHAGLNLIVGSNASGKTTLLEALFVASRAKSFRVHSLAELCGPKGSSWSVFLESRTGRLQHSRVGIGYGLEGTDLRLDDVRNARVSDVVRTLPLQLIDPQSHRLLDDGPAYRRSFVDWGVFHVEHQFLETWRRFQRALKQRNRALRESANKKEVNAWNEELASSGERLTLLRERHTEAIAGRFAELARSMLDLDQVSLSLSRGWAADESLQNCLERNFDQHVRMGTTVQGPQRAELKIAVGESRAKGLVSRGQQKLLISAMLLAQSEHLIESGVDAPVLLLDDFSSELAPEFQIRLAKALSSYQGQKFITSFDPPAAFEHHDAKMFHVEQGTITAINQLH